MLKVEAVIKWQLEGHSKERRHQVAIETGKGPNAEDPLSWRTLPEPNQIPRPRGAPLTRTPPRTLEKRMMST